MRISRTWPITSPIFNELFFRGHEMRRMAGWCATALVLLAVCGVARADDQSVNEKLLAAARSDDIARVTGALDEGAAIDSRNRIGDTALISACKKGLTPMARLLIERGANINQADVSGVTPVMAAAFDGNQEK